MRHWGGAPAGGLAGTRAADIFGATVRLRVEPCGALHQTYCMDVCRRSLEAMLSVDRRILAEILQLGWEVYHSS